MQTVFLKQNSGYWMPRTLCVYIGFTFSAKWQSRYDYIMVVGTGAR
jgi:hypothetical protein